MKTLREVIVCGIAVAAIASAQAQINVSPLTSFGWNNDGWFAPGENGYTYLGTGNLERGLAYGNNHLYLVSRNGGSNVRILDPLTGADLGALDTTGISGGTFNVNMVSVGGDGAIYVGNLTANATTSPFKVYRWANESSIPTVAYSGAPLAGARLGDTLDAIGSGSATRLVAGYNSSPSVSGNNSYAIIAPTAGTATHVNMTGTTAGDFRLGITFGDASHVYGALASGANTALRYTSYADSSGTLEATGQLLGSSALRPMDFAVVGGMPLLAIISYGDSSVRIFDVSDPANPVQVGYGRNVVDPLANNGNGTGAVAWGDISGNTAKLWAMSSNQGIQAFVVTVPEPASIGLAALGGLLFAAWRARRQS